MLTDPRRFDFPTDVSRRGAPEPEGAAGAGRSPHSITPPLDAEAVTRGVSVFSAELSAMSADVLPSADADAMRLLRRPVARSTVAAVLPDLHAGEQERVADAALVWIDALGPVIASSRPPGRWSRIRRRENRARGALEAALTTAGVGDPPAVGTVLAAGIQVPVAAGAWLLVKLAEDPALADSLRARGDLARALAWETVRLCPPTWITARLTRTEVTLGEVVVPAGSVVLVSPLLLGRDETLAPGVAAGAAALARFDPHRWDQDRVRPGAWLPFGAGPHACPGRNLGLAQLTHLAAWAADWKLTLVAPVRVDQSRGIFPRPARLGFAPC